MSAGRVADRVALVTGAAKGQGRSHCIRLAQEGAHVVAVDVCADEPRLPYDQGTAADLEETARQVESVGGKVTTAVADVRDRSALQAAVDATIETYGRLDVVVANAGVIQLKPALAIEPEDWDLLIGTNLTGVWNTVRAALPTMVEHRRGSVVVVSSAAGTKGPPNMAHYAAAKSGLLGLTRSLATELGPVGVRVNAILPTTVDTGMVHWPGAYALFRPDLEEPTRADVEPVFASLNAIPVPWIEPADTSGAVLWLASDESRAVTGIALPVDAGTALR